MSSLDDIVKHGDYGIQDSNDLGLTRYTYFLTSEFRDRFFNGLNLDFQIPTMSHMHRVQIEHFTLLLKSHGIIGTTQKNVEFSTEDFTKVSERVLSILGSKRLKGSLVRRGILQTIGISKQHVQVLNPKVLFLPRKSLAELDLGGKIKTVLEENTIGSGMSYQVDIYKDTGKGAIQF